MSPLKFSVLFLLFLTGCPTSEVLIRQAQSSHLASAKMCHKDSDCASGRCTHGICDDGSCEADADCRLNEICHDSVCISSQAFACGSKDEIPLLQLSSHQVNFGNIYVGEQAKKFVTIRNVGDCLLTISSITLISQEGFKLLGPKSDPGNFPLKIAPFHQAEIGLGFVSQSLGSKRAQLVIGTDDKTVSPVGEVLVDLLAKNVGKPIIIAEPNPINFGYTAFGRHDPVRRTVRIKNLGKGSEGILVTKIYLENNEDFKLEIMDGLTTPFKLPPFLVEEQNSYFDVSISFRPSAPLAITGRLIIEAKGARDLVRTFPMMGSAIGPPIISIHPKIMNFTIAGEAPLTVGMQKEKKIRIANVGHSDLVIGRIIMPDSGRQYSYLPGVLSPIKPGQSRYLTVRYSPTEPSDSSAPNRPRAAHAETIFIESNDTSKPISSVRLNGWAIAGKESTLQIEMTFQNASGGMAGDDYRDVDLELISPDGNSCKKPRGQLDSQQDNSEDGCATWNRQNLAGKVRWTSFGPNQEPEHISLFELGEDHLQGPFVARVHYMNDCAYLPTSLVAGLVGTSASVLIGAISGYAGMPVAVSAKDLNRIISEQCLNRSPTVANVTLRVDGELLDEKQIPLGQAGDFADAFKFSKINGRFEILR